MIMNNNKNQCNRKNFGFATNSEARESIISKKKISTFKKAANQKKLIPKTTDFW